MEEPVRRHRKVEIPLYQALGIVPWQHHAERRVEFGEMQRGIAKCKDAAGLGEGDGLVQPLLNPQQERDPRGRPDIVTLQVSLGRLWRIARRSYRNNLVMT